MRIVDGLMVKLNVVPNQTLLERHIRYEWRTKCVRMRYSGIVVNSFHQEFIKRVHRALIPIEPRQETPIRAT